MPLKLYVWENVLADYTSGIMFALADSPKQARALILKKCPHVNYSELTQKPKEVTTPEAFVLWGGS